MTESPQIRFFLNQWYISHTWTCSICVPFAGQFLWLTLVLKCGGAQKQATWRSFSNYRKCVFATFQGLAIGPTQIQFLPAIRFWKSRIWSSTNYWPSRTKRFTLPAPSPPPLMNLFCISELPNRNLLFKFSQHGSIFGIDYPTVRIPKLWSLEDLEIRNIKKLEAFKSALYSKLVDGYSTEVSCDNPYCKDCH